MGRKPGWTRRLPAARRQVSAPRFSNREKAEAADREVRQRIRVYPHLIAKGKMTDLQASFQIAIMREIAAEYRERDRKEDSLL